MGVKLRLLNILLMGFCLVLSAAEDPRECREQEYQDPSGSCVSCKQCDAGQELSKECGFGFGEDARCVACRPGRFREDGGKVQKCKPCLTCPLIHRLQRENCSATRNTVCGACLPGFYRKTKLSGFQDMECVACGDPPPPYEPHCSSRVKLVPLQSGAGSPRDVALAAVICSALGSVLLALLLLCAIYCRRQLLESKPALVRSQDGPYGGAELSCFDRRRTHELPHRACCHCPQDPSQTCGPALIPAMYCDETCSLGQSRDTSPFQSQGGLVEGPSDPCVPGCLGSLTGYPGNAAEMWPFRRDLRTPESWDPLPSNCGPPHRDQDPGPTHRDQDPGPTHRDQDPGPTHRDQEPGPTHRDQDPGPTPLLLECPSASS